jgi:hypothetical protein
VDSGKRIENLFAHSDKGRGGVGPHEREGIMTLTSIEVGCLSHNVHPLVFPPLLMRPKALRGEMREEKAMQ